MNFTESPSSGTMAPSLLRADVSMADPSAISSDGLAALAVLPGMFALLAAGLITPGAQPLRAWKLASIGASLMLAAAVGCAVLLGFRGAAASGWLRLDAPGVAVGLLVAFIGAIIVRYSKNYLAGEPGQARHARWLMATLSSVSLVLASNHLLLLVLGWMATSAAMHQLLLFYRERPAAVIAAHKKFISARLADGLMLLALFLLFASLGTLRIDELAPRAVQLGWPLAVQASAILVALSALLKCAQLPFNGWLIQVMEAPTPVSALLHAGVVNLGGFVLLRLAPLIDASPAAQGLLVMIGTASAVLAALVATTRISIKVSLAWSTCAQMGFMLVQCGLGLWEMALLHLLAHSLYKAHAFLSSGTVVRQYLVARLGAVPPALSSAVSLASGLAAVLAVWLLARALGVAGSHQPAVFTMAAVFALSLVPLVRVQPPAVGSVAWAAASIASAAGLAMVWLALHALMSALVPPASAHAAWWPIPAIGFAWLFVVQAIVTSRPDGALARRLHPWCYGGLYLDERLHRLVLRWMPLPATARAATTAQSL